MKEFAKKLIRHVLIAACAMLGIIAAFALSGCSSKPVGVSFTLEEINIYVGETRDIYPYVQFTPALSKDRSFTLSADGDCITIDGTNIVGASTGNSTLTATAAANSATLKVKIAYRPANRVDIEAEGNVIQNVTALSGTQPINFTAVVDDFVDPNCDAEWFVNGVKSGEGRQYEFVPSYLGEYIVNVKVQDVNASQSVKIYRKTDAHGEYSGELVQSKSYSPVRFTARETIDTRNPRSTVEWTVNDEVRSQSAVFDFVPSAQGDYEIELFVNGVKRAIADEESVIVKAVGERAPSGRVEFDADGVYVVWDDGAQASSVYITAPGGERTAYSKSDVTNSARFLNGAFDATGLIEVCADDPSEYTVRVFGEGGGEQFTFMQYEKAAEKYIKERALCGNSFIDGTEKAIAWLDELFACGISEASGYLARGVERDEIKSAIHVRAELLGISEDVNIDGSIISVELIGLVGVPEAAETIEVEQVRSALPHIEYDQTKIRSIRSYVMQSDRRKTEIPVNNSEQLWRVAVSKYNPAPESSSAAAAIYTRARTALIAIVGRDYNEYKKVHAIHDWLQFTTVKTNGAKSSSSANYLESVFGGAVTSSGVVTSAGLSKAFALMCGMEGICCTVEIVDIDGAPYYYNKVEIDGLWYVVDAYGGETSYADGTPKKNYEIISHSRLFITDESAVELGLEKSGSEAFDECSTYLVKHARDGVFFDYFVDKKEAADKSVVYAAVAYSFESAVTGDIRMFAIQGTHSFSNNNVATEFELDGVLSAEEIEAFKNLCDETIKKYCKDSSLKLAERGITYRLDGNILHVVTYLGSR